MEELRCRKCRRVLLLYKIAAGTVSLLCPRCKVLNVVEIVQKGLILEYFNVNELKELIEREGN
jgi:phage FluMu protein Com